MSDDLLRETMRRAARGEPPVGDAWARFQLRKRRGQRVRNWIVAMFGIGAVVALFLTLPSGLGTGPQSDVPAGGPFAPNPRAFRVYADPVAGFQVRYPSDWVARGSDGEPVTFVVGPVDDVFPIVSVIRTDGEEPTTISETPRRFFVEIHPIPPACVRPTERCRRTEGQRAMTWLEDEQRVVQEARAAGATTESEATSIAGIPARIHRMVFPERRKPVTFGNDRLDPLYWCGGCAMVQHLVDWHGGWVLDVRVIAEDANGLQERGTDVVQLVDSISVFRPDDRR